MRTKFGVNLRRIRQARGLAQLDVATMLGVSQVTVSCWERGKHPPTIDILFLITSKLKVSADYLLGIKH
jgi:repressor LexA